MSASKKDELLKSLTRRDAQKPPMDVTYENKGIVLEQMIERPKAPEHSTENTDDIASNRNNDVVNNDAVKFDNNSNNDNKIDIDNNSNNDINVASNTDINNDINNDVVEEVSVTEKDAIDELLNANKKVSNPKLFKGFYLDPDVAKVLDKLAKKHGKGIQSQVVNEALRKVFRDKRLL